MCYECLNPQCFYVGALLGANDVVWKHFWNSAIDDLDFRPQCPSCNEPMATWDEPPNSEVKDGALQTLAKLR